MGYLQSVGKSWVYVITRHVDYSPQATSLVNSKRTSKCVYFHCMGLGVFHFLVWKVIINSVDDIP